MRKDDNDRVNRANTREVEDVPEIPRVSFATVLLRTSANGTQGAYTDAYTHCMPSPHRDAHQAGPRHVIE